MSTLLMKKYNDQDSLSILSTKFNEFHPFQTYKRLENLQSSSMPSIFILIEKKVLDLDVILIYLSFLL